MRGDSPRNAPYSYATVCGRCQLVCQRPAGNATVPARLPQFESRITNHESRVTALQAGRAAPALPYAGGLPPQRPPVAIPPCLRVPSWCVSDRKAMPPCMRGSRSSNHESQITNHESRVTALQAGRAVPALPYAGGHPPQRPPVAMPPCVCVASSCVSDREAMPPCERGSSLAPARRGPTPPCAHDSN